MSLLVNKVANSSLKTINLEDFYPSNAFAHFDIKDYLFQGLILKEKDFRSVLKEKDWSEYEDKIGLVYCSTDAIIPMWAYMLVVSYMQPYAFTTYCGNEQEYLDVHYLQAISNFDITSYDDERVVVKGCSQKPVPKSAYAALTARLRPIAKSIMFGEPCSTVPIFKRPRK